MKLLPFIKKIRIYMVTGFLGIGFICFDSVQADIRTQAIITVYSEGRVMTVYKSIDHGRMDEKCYVFHVRRGVRDLEVRVCGMFTVEQVR